MLLTNTQAYKIFCEHPEYTHNTERAGAVAKAQLKKVVEWLVEVKAEVLFNYLKDEVAWENLVREVLDGNNEVS